MADWQNGARTVQTDETAEGDALGVRQVHHWEWTLNGLLVAVSPKLVSLVNPAAQASASDTADVQRVHLVWGPFWIPEHCDKLSVTIGHNRTAGSGSVIWRLYCSSSLYVAASTLDTNLLGTEFESGTIATSDSDTFSIDTSMREIAVMRDGISGLSYLTLTSEASDAGTTATIATLDVSAQPSAAYA